MNNPDQKIPFSFVEGLVKNESMKLEEDAQSKDPIRASLTRKSKIIIDDYVFELSLSELPMVMIYYSLLKLNNPEIDKVLSQFNFSLKDSQGKQIFPRDKESKKS